MRSLFDSMLRMLDDEREQVAHELHDGPQQLLAAIRLMADAVAHAVREGDEQRASEALRRLEEHAGEASDELRETTRQLHPVVLEQRGCCRRSRRCRRWCRISTVRRCASSDPRGSGMPTPHATRRSTASPATPRSARRRPARARSRISLQGDGGGVELTVESDSTLSSCPGPISARSCCGRAPRGSGARWR